MKYFLKMNEHQKESFHQSIDECINHIIDEGIFNINKYQTEEDLSSDICYYLLHNFISISDAPIWFKSQPISEIYGIDFIREAKLHILAIYKEII